MKSQSDIGKLTETHRQFSPPQTSPARWASHWTILYMELKQIKLASEAPTCLQRAAKVALAVDANVFLTSDQSSLMAQFEGADAYYFDPENVTLHMFEAIHQGTTYGFIDSMHSTAKRHYRVTTTYGAGGVSAEIGGDGSHRSIHSNTATAMRHALVTAFCAYYDHVANPEA